MRYELSIDADYLSGSSGWDMAAGIREMMQNGRDAEIEQSAPLVVDHKGTTLRIENEGAVLPREALLLGRSTKRDRQDLAGQWGEGLKLGALALIRGGHSVKIRSGGEVWTPAIEPSEKFSGAKVLVFNIDGGREERKRVRVEIGGICAEDWNAICENFLFLQKRDFPHVKTATGRLLLGDKFRGRIYVKGILVQTETRLAYGYDLSEADIDRDRRLIASWDLLSRLRDVWYEALGTRPDLFETYFKLLDERAYDLDGVATWNAERMPEAAARFVAEKFVERHGDKAIPVANFAESKDVEHLGVKGVVAPGPLAAALARTLGDLGKLREGLARAVTEHHSWSDLDEVERKNLEDAVGLASKVVALDLAEVDVVSFQAVSFYGMYSDGRVLIAKRILHDRRETLATIVHEAAHRHGSDGDKGHVEQIENIWSGIVEHLRDLA